MRATISVFLEQEALKLGLSPQDARRCITNIEVEDADQLLLEPSLKGRIGLPHRLRPRSFDTQAEWMGTEYGSHPSIWWSCLGEIRVDKKGPAIKRIEPELLDPRKRILDPYEGARLSGDVAWPSLCLLHIMLGEENFKRVEDRMDPKTGRLKGNLEQVDKNLNPELRRMILTGEADFYFLNERAEPGVDPRPSLNPQDGGTSDRGKWWDELQFRVDLMAKALADPWLSTRSGANFRSPYQGVTRPEATEGAEGDETTTDEEETECRRWWGTHRPMIAMTGEMVAVQGTNESTREVVGNVRVPHINGIMLIDYRENAKHVIVWMRVEKAKQIIGSIVGDLVDPRFVTRFGGKWHLPPTLVPKDLLDEISRLQQGYAERRRKQEERQAAQQARKKGSAKPAAENKAETGGGNGNSQRDEKSPLTHSMAGKLQAALNGSKPPSNPPAADTTGNPAS